MEFVGKIEKWPMLSAICQAVVGGQKTWEWNGETFPVGFFAGKKLHYIDHQGLRYVQQNTNTQSAYAAAARAGAKIIWIIRLRDNCYLGRVENSNVYRKEI